MLGKRSRSVIVRLSELLSTGSPLDFFIGEPSGNDHLFACDDNGKKPNNCHRIVERDHGVGLAIVMALEKSSSSSGSRGGGGGGGGDRGTGFCSKYFVCGPSGHGRSDWDQGAKEEEEEEEEDYTYVTFHGPRESFTVVYHDRCESEVSEGGDEDSGRGDSSVLGFLSSCQLCGKKLNGQDIYMYRGEKGFCSAECRSAQIVIDERSEQWRSEAPRSSDAWNYSAAAHSEGQIFPTSILAV